MKAIEIDDKATYDVALSRPVTRSGFKLLPRDRHEMRGPFLREVVEAEGWDAIEAAEEVVR